jgi:hypothetical protein
VADIREEHGLRGIKRGEGLRATPLLFEQPDPGDRAGNLTRDQIEETAVSLVQWPEITDADDEAARGAPLVCLRDRQNEARSREGHLAPAEARGHILDTLGLLRSCRLPEGPEIRVGGTRDAG